MTRDPYPLDDLSAWPPRLALLVAAVRAPAQQGELDGEESVAAAFRQARALAPTRRSVARLLAVKIAAAGVVLAAGGYSVAAAAGVVPGPSVRPGRPPAPPVVTSPSPRPVSPPANASPRATDPALTPAATPAAPTRRPATSFGGLCHAFLNAPSAESARMLATPPMRDLVAAAGGADKVRGFCASMVTERPTRAPKEKPIGPAGPSPKGRGAGAPRPTTVDVG